MDPTDKEIAEALRLAARNFETCGCDDEVSFSCPAVKARLGVAVRDRYADVFGFSRHGLYGAITDNERELYRLCGSVEIRDRRVLMLCFAATMAETGDLL